MIKSLTRFRQTISLFNSLSKFSKITYPNYLQTSYNRHFFSSGSSNNIKEKIQQAYDSLHAQEIPQANDKFTEALNEVSQDASNFEDKASVLIGLASVATIQGDPETAIKHLLQAEETVKAGKIQDTTLKGHLYYLLGRNYRLLNNLDEALKYSLESIKIQHVEGEEIDSKVGLMYYNVGKIYKEKGEIDDAILYMAEGAEAFLRDTEDPNPQLSFVFHDLGSMLVTKEEYTQAIKYLEKAREMFEAEEVPKITRADLDYYLGLAYEGTKEHQKAVDVYVEIYELLKDGEYEAEDKLRVAEVLEASAGRLMEMEKTSEALEPFKMCLEIYKGMGEMRSYNVGSTLQFIGMIYGFNEDFKNSVKYIEEAIKYKLKVLGKDHIEIGYAYSSLGNTYIFLKDAKASQDALQKALVILKRHLGEEDPMYIETKNMYTFVVNNANNL